MTTVRLGEDLERRVCEAAQVVGLTQSQLVREAVAARCDDVLSRRLDARLRDYVGALDLGAGFARHTGRQFTDVLEQRLGSPRKPR